MDTVELVEAFPLRIPRPTPYLGGLEHGVEPNAKGLFIRPGNRTVYSVHDHTVLVRVATRAGQVGWGECFGVVAPEIVATIVQELAEPMVVGRHPHQVVEVFDDLYDSLRVRGYFGGFWLDALAGIDQALWDLRGRLLDLPVCHLLGGRRLKRLPAYVSGLPGPDLPARAAVAKGWMERGFSAVKFAGAVAHEGELAEIRAVREAIGPDPQILADFHWRYTGSEAVTIIRSMEPHGLAVAEAPVKPEDVAGLAHVARSVQTPVAAGEELRTVHEYLPRLEARALSIIQPEMLHTGVTGFQRICLLADAFHCRVMPHATIGIGIGQAASLHVAAAIPNFDMHEFQHTIFHRNLRLVDTDMDCREGHFHLPNGPGLGVTPEPEAFKYMVEPWPPPSDIPG